MLSLACDSKSEPVGPVLENEVLKKSLKSVQSGVYLILWQYHRGRKSTIKRMNREEKVYQQKMKKERGMHTFKILINYN